jgi:hypothetical protein
VIGDARYWILNTIYSMRNTSLSLHDFAFFYRGIETKREIDIGGSVLTIIEMLESCVCEKVSIQEEKIGGCR